jgi:hypothetical protein
MTKEHFETLKEEYIGHITHYVKEAGGLFPHISIFAEEKDKTKSKPALIHVPISDDFMESEEGKDEFVDKALPQISKKVNEMFDVYAIAWSSEAWMRMANKPSDVKNWKDIPIKKEVIIITIETENDSECILYEIKRDGQQVTSDGDLVDKIELIKAEESDGVKNVGGRFSKLLKHFKQRDKND